MQSIKWRLSFHGARQTKHLKKNWAEFLNSQVQEKLPTGLQQKSLLQFLEGVESTREVSATAVAEELESEIEHIFQHLLKYLSQCLVSTLSGDDKEAYDEKVLNSDALAKVLHVCEILIQAQEKPFEDECKKDSMKSLIDLLGKVQEVSPLQSMLRLLKKLIAGNSLAQEFVSHGGASVLLSLASQSSDKSLSSSARNLLSSVVISYSGFEVDAQPTRNHSSDLSATEPRGRAVSTSSTGSVSRQSGSQHQFTPRFGNVKKTLSTSVDKTSRTTGHLAVNTKVESSSTAVADQSPLKGLDYAWNVFNEILKNTPIAGTWFGSTLATEHLDESRGDMHAGEDSFFPLTLLLTPEDWEIEEQRIQDLAEGYRRRQGICGDATPALKSSAGQHTPLDCTVDALGQQVLFKFGEAITPSEALSSLSFLLSVISSSQDMQDWMCRSDPIAIIASMLERVEQNLTLLVPCSDFTRAAASGAMPGPTANSANPILSSSAERPSLIDSDSSDFAEYHDQLATLLIHAFLNDPSRPALQSMASIIWRGMLVKNVSFLPLLCSLIGSKHIALSFVALRVVLCLLAVSPSNAVCLDFAGITQTSLTVLVNIMFRGKIVFEQSRVLSTVSGGSAYQSIFLLNNKTDEDPMSLSSDFVQLIAILLEVLQVFAACFANRDSSIPTMLLWLTTVAWLSPDVGESNNDDESKYRCSNCETENAAKQCMSESCMLDNCFRLCEECDKVFHKSVIKRSHIRIPVVLAKPCSVVKKQANGFLPLEQELSDAVLPVYKQVMEHVRALFYNSLDITESGLADRRNLFLKRRAVLGTYLTATVRSVIDDRKFKGLPLCSVLSKLLGVLGLQLLQDPYRIDNMKEDVVHEGDGKSIQMSYWSNMLDIPEFHFGTQDYISKPHDISPVAPPETTLYCSKRVMLSTITQCMGKFLVSRIISFDDTQEPLIFGDQAGGGASFDVEVTHPESTKLALEYFAEQGLDAFLVHCSIDSSSRTLLTNADRQFIWWLLRECVLTASVVPDSSFVVSKLLGWFNWVLRSDAVIFLDNRSRGSGSGSMGSEYPVETKRQPLLKSAGRKPGATVSTLVRTPSGPPRIILATRLFVLQELRLLISKSTSFHAPSWLSNDVNKLSLVQIQAQTPQLSTPSFSRGNSFDSAAKEHEDWGQNGPHSDRSRGKGLTGSCYTCLSTNTAIKDKLVQMSFVTSLFDIVCNEKVLDMLGLPLISGLDYVNPNGRSIAANVLEEMSDLEKEVWWAAYATLAHLCTNSEPAKAALDDRNALQVLINVTMKLINETASLGKLSCVNMDYERTLSMFMAELCVTRGQLLCPSKPFRQASLKFPKLHSPSEQPTNRKLPPQPPVAVKPALQLFVRQLPASLELDLKFNHVSCISLSPSYYVHEFAMISFWATLRPGAIRFPEHRVAILSGMGSIRSPGSLRRGGADLSSFGKMPIDSPMITSDVEARPEVEFVNNNRLGGRRLSRKNISSASVHSMDNDNKWEMESIGRQSSVYGDQTSRGSFNSHQSVTAVLQAFKNMPIAAFMNTDTLDGSGHSRAIKISTDAPSKSDARQLPAAKLQSRLVPLVYCDALLQMSMAGGLDTYKAIVMYHHILLIKAGLSSWIMDDSVTDDHAGVLESPFSKNSKEKKSTDSFAASDISSPVKSLKNSDGYYAVLRKHMSIYLPPQAMDLAHIEQLNWVPNYACLGIRSERSFEILLSTLLSSTDNARSMLIGVLCGLIESNPVNALYLSSSRSMATVLAKIFPYLPDQAQDLLGAVISSVTAYSANVSFVRSLLDVVDDASIASSSTLRSKLLFIFGKAVNQQVPSKFLQFHGGNVLECGIALPELSGPATLAMSADKVITVNTWIKHESLGHSSTSLICKVNLGDQQLCLYLRTVRSSNTRSLSGSGLDMPQMNRIDNWRRSLQLCWCFETSFELNSDKQCRQAMANYLLDVADEAGTNKTYNNKKDIEFVESFAKVVSLIGSLAFPHGYVDLPVDEEDRKWHSLCLVITETGAKCYFDALSLPVHYFTPLGYVEACQPNPAESDVSSQFSLVLSIHKQFLKPVSQSSSSGKSSKEAAVKAVLGGLKSDFNAQKFIGLLADQTVSSELKVCAKEHLQAVEAMVGGFLGSVFGMVVYGGAPSEQDVVAYHDEGMSFKSLPKLGKLRALVGFTCAELEVYQNLMASQQSLLQKQSLLRSSQPGEDIRVAFQGVKICNHASVSEAAALVDGGEVDVRAGLQLVLPLWQTIHLLGGYKCLYSFMKTDASHAIGLLRVIESIIQSDEEASIFKRESADKAIVFAIVTTEKLISTDVLQAYFEIVCSGSWVHINGLTTATKIRDWRPDLLESYVDLAVSCVYYPDVAKSALDWIRDQCFDYPKLLHTFLKSISLTPVLIMLSIWSIGNSATIDICAKPHPRGAAESPETEKKVAFSSNTLCLQLPDSLAACDHRAVPEVDVEATTIAKYKLQLACIRLMKQIFDMMSADPVGVNPTSSAGSLTNEMLQSITTATTIFATLCANPTDREESTNQSHADYSRKSDKIKQQVLKVFGVVPVLKYENIISSEYWQYSASVACWMELLGLVMSRNGSVFLSVMKTVPNLSLSYIALELMRSPAVELRAIGIRLLILFLAATDGKVDAKQLLAFERMNGFAVMCKYLTSHTMVADDSIIEGLFSLMFWQVQHLLPFSRPPSGQLSKGERKSEDERVSDRPSHDSITGNFLQLFGSKDPQQQISVQQRASPDIEAASNSVAVDLDNQKNDSIASVVTAASTASELGSNAASRVNQPASSDKPSSDPRHIKVEEVHIHQVFETILTMIQYCSTLEQVHRVVNRILRCMGNAEIVRDESLEDVYRRNLENFFNCKDWLLILCESVGRFRRQEASVAEEQESGAVMSMSESESMASAPRIRRHDSYFSNSVADSEEAFSAAGDSVFDELSPEFSHTRRSSVDSVNSKKAQTAQFTSPILAFIRKVVIADMLQKYNSSRRWIELFRLSLPETQQMQEEIVLDIIASMHHVTFLNTNYRDQGFNYLKNMGALLDQVLERMKVSLLFCVSVVCALHAASYRCSIELRGRMKDTALPEVKRQFIVKCLIDVGQDIFNRVNCLIEISPSLHAYVAGTDSKIISDSQIIALLFGMFEECFDFLEQLVTANDDNVNSSVQELRDLEAVRQALEMMQALVSVIQACIKVSAEAKKAATKLLDSLLSDSQKVMEFAFVHNFSHVNAQGGNSDHMYGAALDGAENHGMKESGMSQVASSASATSTSSFGWWGAWTTPAVGSTTLVEEKPSGDNEESERSSAEQHSDASGTADSERKAAEPRKMAASQSNLPSDIRAFVYWFCASAQTPMRADLFAKIQKDLKVVFRFAEKVREKYSQRLLRYSKTLQDKRAREKSYASKLVSDAVVAHQAICEKGTRGLLKDVANWIKVYKERMQMGQDAFSGTEKATRLSGKDSMIKPMLSPSAVLSAVQLESFKIPEALIEYLSQEGDIYPSTPTDHRGASALNTYPTPKTPSPLSKIEALNLLIQCFASARHIAEA